MQRLTALVFVMAAMAVSLLFAQEKQTAQPPAMKRPGPGPERARLSILVGNFTTETRIPPSRMFKNGSTGTGTSIIGWGLDSMFLTVDEQSINPVLGNYKGHGILGYEPQEKQYILSMFNNFGDHPQYRGSFIGDTLVLSAAIPMAGRSFEQKLEWFRDGAIVRLLIFNDFGEGMKLVIDQKATPSSGAIK